MSTKNPLCYSKDEWVEILSRGVLKDSMTKRISESLKHGIPEDLRGFIWTFVTRSASLRNKYYEGKRNF